MAAVADAFIAAARAAGRRACLFATEERFTAQSPLRSLPIGEQAVWDPADWPAALARGRRLREQLRRARAKGIRVREVDADDAMKPGTPTRAAVSALVERWLRSRELAPMGFLVQIDPLTLLPEHRLFLAELAPEADAERRRRRRAGGVAVDGADLRAQRLVAAAPDPRARRAQRHHRDADRLRDALGRRTRRRIC